MKTPIDGGKGVLALFTCGFWAFLKEEGAAAVISGLYISKSVKV